MRAVLKIAALTLACTACARSPDDWRARLAGEDPFERGMSALALARIAPADCGEALPVLLDLVEGSDKALATAARNALAGLARHHVQLLIANLAGVKDASPEFRSAVRNALVAAGADAVDPLRAHLLDGGASNPRELGQILADIGPSAIEPLVGDLADPDPRRRVCTAWILSRFGRAAASAAPVLLDRLERDDAPVARQAALALAEVVPESEAARAAIEQALVRRPGLTLAAREALARMGLNRVRMGVRKDIGARLFSLGAEAFVPAIEACASEDAPLQAVAMRHLCLRYAALALGLAPRPTTEPRSPSRLQTDLDDRTPGTRALAALEIARNGARSAMFLQPLASAFRDPHPGVALNARLAFLHVVRCIALEGARSRP